MEYQKIINLIFNTLSQPSGFRARNYIKINDEQREMYDEDNQIKFKSSMLGSRLFDYIDAYILKGTITVGNTADQGQAANTVGQKVTFKLCPIY